MGMESVCPPGWVYGSNGTCSSSSLVRRDSGVYWCESASPRQHSNHKTLNVIGKLKPLLRSSAEHVQEGDSVTFSCGGEVLYYSFNWTFHWYKVSAHQVLGSSLVELLPDSHRGAGGQYTLTSVTPQDQGLYVCQAEMGHPPHFTHHSPSRALWVTGPSSRQPSATP